MKKLIIGIVILSVSYSFSQEKCLEKINAESSITLVDFEDIQCLSKSSINENTIVYSFGIWCSPCRLHLKNAIALKEKYNINLYVLLIEPENDELVQQTVDYLHNIDSRLNIILLKDTYGKKRSKKYRAFLDEITPENFENLDGMSKYIVLDKTGEIKLMTTWKDNRDNDWRDDSKMIENKVIPLLLPKK